MDFENNEKKQEETSQDGFQKEFRPGRSPRPRIHTGQRPAYERPNYRSNNDEGGFRPEGFGAGLQSSSTPQQHGGYRPRNNYNAGGNYGQRPQGGGYGQRPQGGGYGQRPQGGGYGQRPQGGGYGQRRVVMVSVPSRVAMANLMELLLTRRLHASVLPTMIPMPSTP